MPKLKADTSISVIKLTKPFLLYSLVIYLVKLKSLIVIAGFCIPWMLFVKPLLLRQKHKSE